MKSILIVGLGSIGRRHLSHFKDYFDEIDVSDINVERLENAIKQNKIKNGYLDYEEALNKNIYDVVAITTPPHMHLPIAKMASMNGSNLFIEKPLGVTECGWEEVCDICDKKSLKTYIAYCHRHITYTKRLKEIITNGDIGTPIHANMRWGSYLPDWHPWEDYRTFYMAKKEQGGGALLDESHGIDLLRYVLGEVDSVFAVVDKLSDLEISTDDTAFLTLKMISGALVHINFDLTARAPRANLEIVGSQGTVIWDRVNNKLELYTVGSKSWNTEDYRDDGYMNMYPAQAKYFVQGIYENQNLMIDLKDAIKTQRIIDAAFKSSDTKEIIKL